LRGRQAGRVVLAVQPEAADGEAGDGGKSSLDLGEHAVPPVEIDVGVGGHACGQRGSDLHPRQRGDLGPGDEVGDTVAAQAAGLFRSDRAGVVGDVHGELERHAGMLGRRP